MEGAHAGGFLAWPRKARIMSSKFRNVVIEFVDADRHRRDRSLLKPP
jgi:hypothetical protein